jgi:hypothetical protein
MELRRLLAPIEIDQFRASLNRARKRHIGFEETEASRVGEIHLRFGMVYGLYETLSTDEGTTKEMLGGFTLHSRADYALTHPVSALDKLPADSVFEGAQLWSNCYQASLGLKVGFILLAALYGARALVTFPIISPKDTSTLYRHFQRIGPPFEIPFVSTPKREKVFAQTMVLQGAALYRAMRNACSRGFTTRDAHTWVRVGSVSTLAVLSGGLAREKDLVQEEETEMPMIEKSL